MREHFWTEPASGSIKVKVTCPFCDSKIVIDAVPNIDGTGSTTGSYRSILFCRESKDDPAAYADMTFPGPNKWQESVNLKSYQREEEQRKQIK